MSITKYEMPEDLAATAYCLFPQDLEDHPLVLFHATPMKNFDAIDADGFKIPNPGAVVPGAGLPSVSFAKRSSASLTHAVTKRHTCPGDYCVFAVRYENLDRHGIKVNTSDIHDYTLEPPPEIIGYCIIPSTYVHR